MTIYVYCRFLYSSYQRSFVTNLEGKVLHLIRPDTFGHFIENSCPGPSVVTEGEYAADFLYNIIYWKEVSGGTKLTLGEGNLRTIIVEHLLFETELFGLINQISLLDSGKHVYD